MKTELQIRDAIKHIEQDTKDVMQACFEAGDDPTSDSTVGAMSGIIDCLKWVVGDANNLEKMLALSNKINAAFGVNRGGN